MPVKIHWLCPILTAGFLFSSCRSGEQRSYAIRDFTPALQPYLTQSVATGIVGYDSATLFIQAHATNKELVQLSLSEHPILRAVALSEMQKRPGFDHFAVIMDHLDDTAVVSMDAGEWGTRFRMIADNLVEEGKWKTIADRDRTLDALITRHNHLRSAYTGLTLIGPQEKYRPYILEMVQRERPYEEREDALYALARFRKKEDVPLIRQIFLSNLSQLHSLAFQLMRDFPDTSYLEILQRYYPRRFYKFILWDQEADRAVEYIKTVASYRTDSCAHILGAMLSRKPFMPYPADTTTLKREIIRSIWDNPYPAYTKLRRQTRADIQRYKVEDSMGIYLPAPPLPKDTASEPIRWW